MIVSRGVLLMPACPARPTHMHMLAVNVASVRACVGLLRPDCGCHAVHLAGQDLMASVCH